MPNVLQSDHRPIMLDQSIELILRQFMDAEKMQSKRTPFQPRGEINIKGVNIKFNANAFYDIMGYSPDKVYEFDRNKNGALDASEVGCSGESHAVGRVCHTVFRSERLFCLLACFFACPRSQQFTLVFLFR